MFVTLRLCKLHATVHVTFLLIFLFTRLSARLLRDHSRSSASLQKLHGEVKSSVQRTRKRTTGGNLVIERLYLTPKDTQDDDDSEYIKHFHSNRECYNILVKRIA